MNTTREATVIETRQDSHDVSNAQLRDQEQPTGAKIRGWRKNFKNQTAAPVSSTSSMNAEKDDPPAEKWTLGILSDKKTDEVPGE